MDHFGYLFRVCHAFLSVHCSLVVTCWERANLLAVLSVLLYLCVCFCHFLMWCPGSGVVLLVSIPDLWFLTYFCHDKILLKP